MTIRGLRKAVLAVISLVALSSCQLMKDLFSLQREIAREFEV